MGAQLLIVEDDLDVREALAALVSDAAPDLTVLTAANGQEALEVLDGGARPCLVLLDLVMPVMNGPEFLDALKTGGRWTPPVVIVSAFVKKFQSLDYPGIVGMLPKPVSPEDLLAVVTRHCASG